MNIRFICDVTNPIFKEWLKKKLPLDKKYDMDIERLRIENERLNKDRNNLWDELWSKLQESGVIPAHFYRENFGMNYNPETGQLFIQPTDVGPRGPQGHMIELPEELVEALTGRSGGGRKASPSGVH